MGNLLAYSGIVTKIRGMEAKLLTETQFDEIKAMKSVPEAVTYLIQNTVYREILDMMDVEINHAKNGEPAYIGIKMNSLTDKKIIDKLVDASCAGVKIEMMIRGICCLVAGVKDKTENIRVTSIVGRFLEHSRIYMFGTKERRKYYIASADFMTRNTVKRVEVAAPVYDPIIQEKLEHIFDTMSRDNQKARELRGDGLYYKVQNEDEPLNSQEQLYEEAYNR